MLIHKGGTLTKSSLTNLLIELTTELGTAESAVLVDRIRAITFTAATISGQSVALEDIFPPVPITAERYHATRRTIRFERSFYNGQISNHLRHKLVTKEWSHMTAMGDYTEEYFATYDPDSILGGISFSGARGSLVQAKQVIGARGFSIDIDGNVKRNPIRAGLCNGMDTLDVAISAYGARKGLIDTALRTADAGYLTRRLVDSTQDIVIRELDCGSSDTLSFEELSLGGKTCYSTTRAYLLGRVLGISLVMTDFDRNSNLLSPKQLVTSSSGTDVLGATSAKSQSRSLELNKNTLLTNSNLDMLSDNGLRKLKVRTPFTCSAATTVCRNCYGMDLSSSRRVSLGTSVGIIASQSIGEPGTQMILRTFHSGGVVSGSLRSREGSPHGGKIIYGRSIEASTVFIIRKSVRRRGFVTKKGGTLFLSGETFNSRFYVNPGVLILVADGEKVYDDQEMIIKMTRKKYHKGRKKSSEAIERPVLEGTREILISAAMATGRVKQELTLGSHKVLKRQTILPANPNHSAWIMQGVWFKIYQKHHLRLGIKSGLKLTKKTPVASIKVQNFQPGILNECKTKAPLFIQNEVLVIEKALAVLRNKNEASELFLTVRLPDGKLILAELMMAENEGVKDGSVLAATTKLPDEYKSKGEGIIYQPSENVICYIPEVRIETSSLHQRISKGSKNSPKNICIHKGTQITESIISTGNGIVQVTGRFSSIKYGHLIHINNFTDAFRDKVKKETTPFFTSLPSSVLRHCKRLFITDYVLVEEVFINNSWFLLLRDATAYQLQSFLPYKIVSSPKESRPINFVTRFTPARTHGERIAPGDPLFTCFEVIIKIQTPNNNNLSTRENFILKLLTQKTPSTAQDISIYKVGLVSAGVSTIPNVDFDTESLKPIGGNVVRNLCVPHNTYTPFHATLVSTNVQLTKTGVVNSIVKRSNFYDIEILTASELPCILYNSSTERLNVKEGDFIKRGTKITSSIYAMSSGQIYRIERNRIYIRNGTLQHIDSEIVQNVAIQFQKLRFLREGTILGYEFVYQGRTSDIALGIKDVARILEIRCNPPSSGIVSPVSGTVVTVHTGHHSAASPTDNEITEKEEKTFGIYVRNRQDGTSGFLYTVRTSTRHGKKHSGGSFPEPISSSNLPNLREGQYVHVLQPLVPGFLNIREELKILHNFYSLEEKVSLASACEKSLRHIRIRLTSDIQNEYLKYGVRIAVKHIEVIVCRLTSKLVVIDAGATGLLPGEYIEQYQMRAIESVLIDEEEIKKPLYEPVLLGLTKVSLNSNSFLSAASFQQAVNVLTAAAIRGRRDWFLGLKENVISGKILPKPSDPRFLKKYANVVSNKLRGLAKKVK